MHLKRESCRIEKSADGNYVVFRFDANESGEVAVHFLATEVDGGASFNAVNVSRQKFDSGLGQSCRLLLCQDLEKSLEGMSEDQRLVIELRANSSDAGSVTGETSYFKMSSENSTLQVEKQKVQRGAKGSGPLVTSEPLFGNLPRRTIGDASTSNDMDDAEGGECVICLTNPKDVVILHCRHVCLCASCAAITSSTWSFQCPVCRGRVAAMVAMS